MIKLSDNQISIIIKYISDNEDIEIIRLRNLKKIIVNNIRKNNYDYVIKLLISLFHNKNGLNYDELIIDLIGKYIIEKTDIKNEGAEKYIIDNDECICKYCKAMYIYLLKFVGSIYKDEKDFSKSLFKCIDKKDNTLEISLIKMGVVQFSIYKFLEELSNIIKSKSRIDTDSDIRIVLKGYYSYNYFSFKRFKLILSLYKNDFKECNDSLYIYIFDNVFDQDVIDCLLANASHEKMVEMFKYLGLTYKNNKYHKSIMKYFYTQNVYRVSCNAELFNLMIITLNNFDSSEAIMLFYDINLFSHFNGEEKVLLANFVHITLNGKIPILMLCYLENHHARKYDNAIRDAMKYIDLSSSTNDTIRKIYNYLVKFNLHHKMPKLTMSDKNQCAICFDENSFKHIAH